ncbi:MAG TPA: inositol monophosphatase [Polyangiaceae bacterium]|nr:inositol monophosphatase [Polyangiaceae bacterium]
MDHDDFSSDRALAFALGQRASEVALARFRRGVATRQKPDGSLVTDADIEVERHLLEMLARERPDDAVLSEESGEHGASSRRWIIDPIDGTSYFASGRESWGTHVALERDGQLVVGLVTRPTAAQWYWATRGGGAHRGALGSDTSLEVLRVSTTDDPARARVMSWSRQNTELEARLKAGGHWVTPILDGALELAAGRLDALFDDTGYAWDLAPFVLLVEEAGGRFVDHEGGRRLDRFGGWLTNGRIDAAFGVPGER